MLVLTLAFSFIIITLCMAVRSCCWLGFCFRSSQRRVYVDYYFLCLNGVSFSSMIRMWVFVLPMCWRGFVRVLKSLKLCWVIIRLGFLWA